MAKRQKSENTVKKGVLTKRLPRRCWQEFTDFLFSRSDLFFEEHAEKTERYVWRGHRCSSWRLKSAFDRQRGKSQPRAGVLRRHHTSFAYAARGKLGEFGLTVRELKSLIQAGILNENHVWALAQHYGMATPLLDWCLSPFVAAYFAFSEESRLEDVNWDNETDLGSDWNAIKERLKDKDKKKSLPYDNRVVFGLDYRQVCQHTQLDYFSPMSSEHPRLINQRGLFTVAKDGADIETLVRDNWKEGGPWLIKIEIPNDNKRRDDFLRKLNLMNINHASLFPDISGAAQFCNLGLKFPGYSTDPGAGP